MFTDKTRSFDVIVAGSGAGGLATAVTCQLLGLHTLVAEASDLIGGSTALSGGVLWIPGNPFRTAIPEVEDLEDALAYIEAESRDHYDQVAAKAFIGSAGAAVAFLGEQGGLAYTGPSFWPDYHPALTGSREGGRSMRVQDFDGRLLGDLFPKLRPPLASMTLFGGMMVSGNDLYHLLRARRSLASAWHVCKILARHCLDRLSHQRGTRLCNGNALVARLLYQYRQLGGEIATSTSLTNITREGELITGCKLIGGDGIAENYYCRALVLAGGGIGVNHDLRRSLGNKRSLPSVNSLSLVPSSNRGDNLRAAIELGARIDRRQHDIAAWVPVSAVSNGRTAGYFPHFFDRSKPGFIMVDERGERFVNEASSYHDIGSRMKQLGVRFAYILCDHRALRRYGVGVVPPGTLRLSRWIRSGYLMRAASIDALAQQIGVDSETLRATLTTYNAHASSGSDPVFKKGETPYELYIGDPDHHPNPCVAPLDSTPLYAIRVELGDIGTFCGLATNPSGEVVDHDDRVIKGLYAVGNDRASVFGGTYPAAGITLGPALTHGVTVAHHIAGRDWPPTA